MPGAFKIIVSAEAEHDIEEIIGWICLSTPAEAERWYEGLVNTLRSLGTFPDRCPISPETRFCLVEREVRQLLYGSGFWRYRILFVIDGDTVLITHIRHGARLYLGQAPPGLPDE